VAQWVKALLIGHSACWTDGLMALANLGSNAGLEGGFQLHCTSGHAIRLNSWTGIEGLPVSSLNCDRPLHSGIRAPETVMSMDGQITDSVRQHSRACYDPGSVAVACSVLSGVGHRGQH